LDERAKCTNVPKISTFKSKRKNRIPVHKRKQEEEDFDEFLERKRANRPAKPAQETEEYTFEPDVHMTKSKDKRTVDDLLRWGTDKRFKLANQRLKKYEGVNYSFKPVIDKKSKKMANKKRKGRNRVEDRLIQAGRSAKKKKEEMMMNETKNLFKPDININSKKILREKDDLIKKPNGTQGNLDFFEAVAKSDFHEQSLSPKKSAQKRRKKRRRIGSRSQEGSRKKRRVLEELNVFNFEDIRLIKAGSKQKKKRRRKKNNGKSRERVPQRLDFHSPDSNKSARGRSKERIEYMENAEMIHIINTTRNKNEEMLPTYVSPYNKVMLASGLPLKTIIKKTNKAKNAWKAKNDRKKDYSKYGGYTGPSNSKSRSKRRKEEKSRSQSARKKAAQPKNYKRLTKEERSLSAKRAFVRQMENEGLKEMIKMDMMPLRQGKKFLKTRYTQEQRKKRMAREAKYGSPKQGIREEHLPAYDGGTFRPEEWTKMIKRRNRSNSVNRVRKLFYKDYSNSKWKNGRRGRSMSHKKGKKVKKKIKNLRNTSHSPTPVYLKKYKKRGRIDGVDDYKSRLKLIGNAYMYESVENIKYKNQQDMMEDVIRGIHLR